MTRKDYIESLAEPGVEQVEFSALLTEVIEKAGTVWVHGFASMNSLDRDKDKIDARKFNLDAFRKNPQLWVNHQLWQKDGNGIAVGLVPEVHPVEVISEDHEKVLVIRDLGTNEIIRDDLDRATFNFPKGARGLFVVAEVQEPEVATQVKSGRLNSFSWQGSLKRSPTGAIKSIDLWEISLVNLPANQDAHLRIGKSISIRTSDGVVINMDLEEAVKVVFNPTSPVGENIDALYAVLYGASAEEEPDKSADANSPEEGGDYVMDEKEMKALLKEQGDAIGSVVADALKENLSPVEKQLAEVLVRVDTLEEGAKSSGGDDDKGGKDGKDSEGVEKAEAPDSDAIIAAITTSVVETVKTATEPLISSIAAISDRIVKLEKKPGDSKAASDAETPDVEAAFTEELSKGFAALDAKGQHQANLSMVGQLLIPTKVANRTKS